MTQLLIFKTGRALRASAEGGRAGEKYRGAPEGGAAGAPADPAAGPAVGAAEAALRGAVRADAVREAQLQSALRAGPGRLRQRRRVRQPVIFLLRENDLEPGLRRQPPAAGLGARREALPEPRRGARLRARALKPAVRAPLQKVLRAHVARAQLRGRRRALEGLVAEPALNQSAPKCSLIITPTKRFSE